MRTGSSSGPGAGPRTASQSRTAGSAEGAASRPGPCPLALPDLDPPAFSVDLVQLQPGQLGPPDAGADQQDQSAGVAAGDRPLIDGQGLEEGAQLAAGERAPPG